MCLMSDHAISRTCSRRRWLKLGLKSVVLPLAKTSFKILCFLHNIIWIPITVIGTHGRWAYLSTIAIIMLITYQGSIWDAMQQISSCSIRNFCFVLSTNYSSARTPSVKGDRGAIYQSWNAVLSGLCLRKRRGIGCSDEVQAKGVFGEYSGKYYRAARM